MAQLKCLSRVKKRAKITNFVETDAYFLVDVDELSEEVEQSAELKALIRSVKSSFETYVKLGKKISPEMIHQIHAIDDPFRLADAVIVHLNIKLEEKQDILETNDASERLEKIFGHMKSEIEILQVEKAHKNPCQEADGEDSKGVLSQRADACDPERARRER